MNWRTWRPRRLGTRLTSSVLRSTPLSCPEQVLSFHLSTKRRSVKVLNSRSPSVGRGRTLSLNWVEAKDLSLHSVWFLHSSSIIQLQCTSWMRLTQLWICLTPKTLAWWLGSSSRLVSSSLSVLRKDSSRMPMCSSRWASWRTGAQSNVSKLERLVMGASPPKMMRTR